MQIIMEGRSSPTKNIIETSANFFAKELGLNRSRFTLLIMTEKGMARKGYYDQPWEIEAFSKERILANKIFSITGA